MTAVTFDKDSGIHAGAPGVLVAPDPDEIYQAMLKAKSVCDQCGWPIYWATTWPKGKPIALDYFIEKDAGDGQFVINARRRELLALYVARDAQTAGIKGRTAHIRTCPERGER